MKEEEKKKKNLAIAVIKFASLQYWLGSSPHKVVLYNS